MRQDQPVLNDRIDSAQQRANNSSEAANRLVLPQHNGSNDLQFKAFARLEEPLPRRAV